MIDPYKEAILYEKKIIDVSILVMEGAHRGEFWEGVV
jgi:hypothetical protein